MSKISDYIKVLKDKKRELERLEKERTIKRMNNDPIQFYEDSLKMSRINDGMVILITPDKEYRELSPSGTSHKKTCQELLDSISDKHIDLDLVEGDFGDIIPKEYNSIFIRMASILNGSTVIYFPSKCNDFQISKLEEFNENVKSFNASKNDGLRVTFEYNGKSDKETNDLDEVIALLKDNYTK